MKHPEGTIFVHRTKDIRWELVRYEGSKIVLRHLGNGDYWPIGHEEAFDGWDSIHEAPSEVWSIAKSSNFSLLYNKLCK